MERAVRRGNHQRTLHRLRRLCDLVPALRDRLRTRTRCIHRRFTSKKSWGSTTASTDRRAAPHAPGHAPASACGNPEADMHLFGRERTPEEVSGIYSDILLTRATDDFVYETGQDGGLVSAILIWCIENNIIDGALTSGVESLPNGEPGWKAFPMVATNPEEVLRGAGSRYTYSANTMAFNESERKGPRTSCPRGYELPNLGAARDVGIARSGRSPNRSSSTSVCFVPNRSTTPFLTSCSRSSTASRRRTSPR